MQFITQVNMGCYTVSYPSENFSYHSHYCIYLYCCGGNGLYFLFCVTSCYSWLLTKLSQICCVITNQMFAAFLKR